MDWGYKNIPNDAGARIAKSSALNGSVERQLAVARHSRKVNVAYADGHAASRSGDQLLQGSMPFTGGTYSPDLVLDHIETE